MLGRARYLALVAVAGIVTTTVITFGLAIVTTVDLIGDLIGGGWQDKLVVVSILEIIDLHLLAIVQLIVVIGLHELFIGDLDVPEWLGARSLDDLKKPIVDVLIVFVAVKGIERFITADDAVDALVSVAAVAVLILALTGFRLVKGRRTSG